MYFGSVYKYVFTLIIFVIITSSTCNAQNDIMHADADCGKNTTAVIVAIAIGSSLGSGILLLLGFFLYKYYIVPRLESNQEGTLTHLSKNKNANKNASNNELVTMPFESTINIESTKNESTTNIQYTIPWNESLTNIKLTMPWDESTSTTPKNESTSTTPKNESTLSIPRNESTSSIPRNESTTNHESVNSDRFSIPVLDNLKKKISKPK